MRSLSFGMLGLVAALVAAPAGAQSKAPANSAQPGDEEAGTTIIGDRDSPIGLYLTPWKNEFATRGMDRPAQIVQEQMAPLDPQVFKRQNVYYDTIQEYRQAELGGKK